MRLLVIAFVALLAHVLPISSVTAVSAVVAVWPFSSTAMTVIHRALIASDPLTISSLLGVPTMSGTLIV